MTRFCLTWILKIEKRKSNHEESGGIFGGIGQVRKRFARVSVSSEALHEPKPRGQTRDERPQKPHPFHALGAVDVDGCKNQHNIKRVILKSLINIRFDKKIERFCIRTRQLHFKWFLFYRIHKIIMCLHFRTIWWIRMVLIPEIRKFLFFIQWR